MINMLLSQAAASIHADLEGEDLPFNGCATDSRRVSTGELFIALRGERYDGHAFIAQARDNGAVAAMVEQVFTDRGTMPLIIVEDCRRAMGRLAGYWRGCFKIPLIAVTGSNGKTTVKEMIASILSRKAPVLSTQGNLNNDIGVPLTLFSLEHRYRYAVVEMGANHPGEIAALTSIARPTVAVITQCAPAHLQGFGSVDGVARAKAEIFEGLGQGGTAIVNADDDHAMLWRDKARAYRQISFSMRRDADVYASGIDFDTTTNISSFTLHVSDGETGVQLPLPGHHNVHNALAAAACCVAVGIGIETIKTGLETIKSIKGRLQIKKGKSGARICDDTYNANPASLEAALTVVTSYPGRHWLVLGDMGELGNSAASLHYASGEKARQAGFERLFALGPLSIHTVKGFGDGAVHFPGAEQLIDALITGLSADINVLVKGSRAMAMERIVNAIGEDS